MTLAGRQLRGGLMGLISSQVSIAEDQYVPGRACGKLRVERQDRETRAAVWNGAPLGAGSDR